MNCPFCNEALKLSKNETVWFCSKHNSHYFEQNQETIGIDLYFHNMNICFDFKFSYEQNQWIPTSDLQTYLNIDNFHHQFSFGEKYNNYSDSDWIKLVLEIIQIDWKNVETELLNKESDLVEWIKFFKNYSLL